MKHDFTPEPEVHTADVERRGMPPELVLIGAIFVTAWLAFAVQLLTGVLH